MGSEASDEGTDDSHGEHSEIHQIGRILLAANDPIREVYPDQHQGCKHRNCDRHSV